MTRDHAMRRLVCATLLGIAFLLATPAVSRASDLRQGAATPANRASRVHSGATSVTLQVSAGYQDIYRGTAWAPVRVTVRNGTGADIRGALEIPQSSQSPSVGGSPSFHGLYQAPVTLPAGSTRHVSLYVPGSGVQGQVNVRLQEGDRTLATGSAYPMGIDSSALLIGVMAGSPGDMGWIAPAIQQQVTTHVVRLSAATLDPVPEALAAFDIIALTNVDTSQLDSAQLGALQRYVHNGGSLLLVGGPAWQETLRPLAATLLPGRLSGMRILPDLHSLLPLGPLARPAGRQTAAVSVLARPSGTVVAGQAGVPLVVRKMEGQGVIEYLAFDPALDPVQRWNGAPRLLQHLVAMAAPLAISRTWSPQGFRRRFRTAFTSMALTNELSNLPPATLPLLAIFAALTLVYVLILGPANFLVLRWIGRQSLAWITVPTLALTYLGSAFGLTMHLKGSATLLNSVGVITLDGAGPHPATFYLGLAAPLPGDYHLTYSANALAAPLPELSHLNGFFWRSASSLHSTPLGLRLQEGSPTQLTFLAMKRWSTRDATLNTAVQIPGTIQSNLAVDRQGDIAGSIHNGTNLDLVDPVLVGGQSIAHLSAIRAGATMQARVQPNDDLSGQDASSLWSHLYGGSDLGEFDGPFGFRGCCDQFSFPPETQLIDRVRNAVAILSQAQPQSLSSRGAVLLVGWSEQPLGSFTVDGSAPRRRDLNLVVVPLSVHLPSQGPFRLRAGTLTPHLVDILPRAPQSNSFGFSPQNNQPVSIGPGGALTFEFDLPGARHVRFRRLTLNVNFDTAGTNAGHVYDWRMHRWVSVDLSGGDAALPNPNRFVSPDGQIILQLQATADSGDLTISDPDHDVQLSGAGAVT